MFLFLFVLRRHIIHIFNFFSYKIMTHIIRAKLPYFSSIIIIFVLQFENDLTLGLNVTNKYGQVFSQVNCPFYLIFIPTVLLDEY